MNDKKNENFSIFGYTDYREYLKDFYELKKSGVRGYSFRAFSKASGFSSPNFLKLVIDGERNISPDACQKFIKGLALSGPSAEYFQTLVLMNQAKTDAEKEKYFRILEKLTPHKHRRKLSGETLHYLSHWLFPVLREMTHLEDFREDPYWIARRLNENVSVHQIAMALEFLKKQQFLQKNEFGKLQPQDNFVLSSDEVASLAVRNYHRQMLGQAEGMLEKLPVESREYSSSTFILPQESLAKLKTKIKNFVKELNEWAVLELEKEKAESIIQFNIQMYPHTAKGSKE